MCKAIITVWLSHSSEQMDWICVILRWKCIQHMEITKYVWDFAEDIFRRFFLERKWLYFESFFVIFCCYSLYFHYHWIKWWHDVIEHAASIYPSCWWTTCGCFFVSPHYLHYDDVIMGGIASQITSRTIVYSTVYSAADQSKHQSSASLAFVRGIHRGPVNSPHKWPVTRKMFPFDGVIMRYGNAMVASRYLSQWWPRLFMNTYVYFLTFCENNGGRCMIIIAVNICSFKTSGIDIVFSKGSDVIMKFCYSEKVSEPKWLFELFIERCHGMEITSNFKPDTIMQDGMMAIMTQ